MLRGCVTARLTFQTVALREPNAEVALMFNIAPEWVLFFLYAGGAAIAVWIAAVAARDIPEAVEDMRKAWSRDRCETGQDTD